MSARACLSLLLRVALALMTVSAWITGAEAQVTAPVKSPFRNAAVHRDLVMLFEESRERDPIKTLGPAVDASAHEVSWAAGSLVERSDILNHRGLATLLPKGALLHLPESLSARNGLGDGGSAVVNWPDFFRRNSQWIHPLKVRLGQALGDEPIDQALIARIAKTGKVVVAIYFDQPISVRPHSITVAAAQP